MITRRVRHPFAVLCLSTLASLALILGIRGRPDHVCNRAAGRHNPGTDAGFAADRCAGGATRPGGARAQKVVVIRAIASDQVGQTPRYSLAQANTIFNSNLSTLWQNVSYGNISISATVTSLVTMPRPRSDYMGGGGSSLGNLTLIMNDAVAAAGAIDYTGVKAVFVLFAEPVTSTFFFRGVENTKMLAIGAGGSLVAMPSAAFWKIRPKANRTCGGAGRMRWAMPSRPLAGHPLKLQQRIRADGPPLPRPERRVRKICRAGLHGLDAGV